MLIEDIVTSEEKYVVIGRDSDGYQWELGRDFNYDQAIEAGLSAVEDDLKVYGSSAEGEKTSQWSWRVRSPEHDYTAWITIYKQDDEVEEGVAWKRRGSKITRQFRCTSGRRKGRVVASPSQCFKPIDLKKRANLRKTKAKLGPRLQRKAGRTKKFNPVSKRIKAMNKKR